MLNENSKFFCKPELEIYADDVICSHGSTSSSLDRDSLFYLLSRGVHKNKAKEMLITAFIAEALDEIEDEGTAPPVKSGFRPHQESAQRRVVKSKVPVKSMPQQQKIPAQRSKNYDQELD